MRRPAKVIPCFVSLILISALLSLANAQREVVAYWTFDSMTNNTFKDNTGHGYNATWTGSGVALVPGYRGNAVSCPIGGGFEIPVANSATGFATNHFSVEAWVSVDTITSGQQNILNFQYITEGVRNGWSFTLNAGSPAIEAASFDGSDYVNDIAGVVLQTNTWYHLVGTFDSLSWNIYVNGVLQGTASGMGGINLPGANANIGGQKRSDGSLDCFFGGKIDELKFYNYTLPADSVLAHYNFYTQMPALVSPANGAVNQPVSPTLSWSTVNGAKSFGLQVSSSMAFATTIFSKTGLTSLSATTPGLSSAGVYYWRADAAFSSGTGQWCSAWSFTTIPAVPAAPLLVSPGNNAANQALSPNLAWGAVKGATSYSVQLSGTSGFTSMALNQSGLTATDASANGLNGDALYYWRANATNAGGTSAWSTIWSFITIPCPSVAPALSSPGNGSRCNAAQMVLNWGHFCGATSYTLQISTASTFADYVYFQSNLVDTSQQVSGLLQGNVFFWRINAALSNGNETWSSAWSFNLASSVIESDVRQSSQFFYFKNGAVGFRLAQESPVTISLCDIRGRSIVVIDRVLTAGSYNLALKKYNFASGLYIIRFRAGEIDRKIISFISVN
jgi:hypothetical protein